MFVDLIDCLIGFRYLIAGSWLVVCGLWVCWVVWLSCLAVLLGFYFVCWFIVFCWLALFGIWFGMNSVVLFVLLVYCCFGFIGFSFGWVFI